MKVSSAQAPSALFTSPLLKPSTNWCTGTSTSFFSCFSCAAAGDIVARARATTAKSVLCIFTCSLSGWIVRKRLRNLSALVGRTPVSRSPQHLPRQPIRRLAVRDHRDTVHQHVLHSHGQLIGFFEGCGITNAVGIEHHDVRPHATLQYTAVGQTKFLGRQRAEFPDGFLEGQLVLLPHVL